MNKASIIKWLELKPHPLEGGYFCRTYTSDVSCNAPDLEDFRAIMSSIYYMLTDENPLGYLHFNKSDIIHYFHQGSPILYTIIRPNGELHQVVLGPELDKGQQLQLLVKGGSWKASELLAGEFGLISEAVTPGFDYRDNILACDKTIKSAYPEHWPAISKYIKATSHQACII